MTKKVKFSLFFILFMLIICIIGLIQAKNITKTLKDTPKNSQQGQSEKVSIKDMLITETKDGKKYWEVFAGFGEYASSKNIADLKDVVGNFYKNGKVVVSFKANKGTYENGKKRITLEDNALIVAEDGTALKAQKIVWEGEKDKIVAYGNVQITKSDNLYATCQRSEFSSDFKNFKTFVRTTTKVYSK